jgi:phenylalanine-4-hydroxylase
MKFKTSGKEIEFKEFSKEESDVWRTLCERQQKKLSRSASRLRKIAWKKLRMEEDKIPDFVKINKKLKKITGWEVVMTDIEYEESNPWIEALKDKKFRITDYIRPKSNLHYTPLPDIFHDAYGHLPFLALPQYARIAQKFGIAMERAKTRSQKDVISNNWWYGIEFSLIRESGKIKALGTGLMSSGRELEHALSSKVQKLPYNGKVVGNTPKSPHKMHKKLFVLENLGQLEDIVDSWLK